MLKLNNYPGSIGCPHLCWQAENKIRCWWLTMVMMMMRRRRIIKAIMMMIFLTKKFTSAWKDRARGTRARRWPSWAEQSLDLQRAATDPQRANDRPWTENLEFWPLWEGKKKMQKKRMKKFWRNLSARQGAGTQPSWELGKRGRSSEGLERDGSRGCATWARWRWASWGTSSAWSFWVGWWRHGTSWLS